MSLKPNNAFMYRYSSTVFIYVSLSFSYYQTCSRFVISSYKNVLSVTFVNKYVLLYFQIPSWRFNQRVCKFSKHNLPSKYNLAERIIVVFFFSLWQWNVLWLLAKIIYLKFKFLIFGTFNYLVYKYLSNKI